jgi:hypothetical protein
VRELVGKPTRASEIAGVAVQTTEDVEVLPSYGPCSLPSQSGNFIIFDGRSLRAPRFRRDVLVRIIAREAGREVVRRSVAGAAPSRDNVRLTTDGADPVRGEPDIAGAEAFVREKIIPR